MNIAQCTDTFLPVVDGVGRVVTSYAEGLSRMGHQVTVITPIQERAFRAGDPYEVLDYRGIGVPTARQYRTGIATLDAHYMDKIKWRKFDVVHAHSPSVAGREALRIANKLKVPLIGTFHSKYRNDILRYVNSEILANWGTRCVVNFYEHCDEVWTVSNNAAETLRDYGYKGDIQIIRNGSTIRQPDPAWEARAREAFRLSLKPILLYAGQIDKKKNIPSILSAAAILRRKGYDFQLVLAGQGQDTEMLKCQSRELGLEDCTLFTGHLYDTELLYGLYMSATLFVFPSLYDTGGLVVSEAAMMGTPSLVVENSAPAEFICNGESGFVCKDTAESICAMMEKYLFEMDEPQRKTIALHAQNTLPESWGVILRQVEERYMGLCGQERYKH